MTADDDGRWTIVETGHDPRRHRVTEALFTLGSGGFGTRGAVEEGAPGSVPMLLAAGVYTGRGADQQLLPGPDWTGLALDPAPEEDQRALDLRSGVLHREAGDAGEGLRTLRFASAARPGVVVLRAEGPAAALAAGPALRASDGGTITGGSRQGREWARAPGDDATGSAAGIVGVATQHDRLDAGRRTVERIGVYATHAPGALDEALDHAVRLLTAAEEAGVERLLGEHREAWARRWDAVDVRIPADPEAERAIRYALFQLWTNTDCAGEAAVGARGVSGTGYRGHVFWDADVFVLPALASIAPAAARAVVEYRIRRLPAARAHARAAARSGARFPWESAADGTDVTPVSGYLGGRPVPILTGSMEEHITADVPWAACFYAAWCGDRELLTGPARPLLAETARYWASRCRVDAEGRAHIDRVIGPDEYHEAVDDNAFTNVMARWNLRRAAALEESVGAGGAESRGWRDLAERLVDGYDPATGVYEQFAGYHALEPLLVDQIGTPPVAADVLMGRERIAGSQVIKQTDVLMLHHLVPDEVAAGSLGPNLEFYVPRTSHGSSLSPAVTAAVLARGGRPEEALDLLRIALVLDLDDLSGMTAAGLHLATLGGVWQATLGGFAGVRVRGGVLGIDPVLPEAWPQLSLRFRALGRRIRLDVDRHQVEIRVDGPVDVDLCGAGVRRVRDVARADLERLRVREEAAG